MQTLGLLQTFSDQLAREWAIETGQIENLYDIERGVTVSLIEQGFQAALLEHGSTNKPPEQVLALITDQRDALQGLFDFIKQDRPLSTSYIKELHAAMTRSQPTTEAFDPQGNRVEVELLRGEWKRSPNFPMRDGVQFLYCPPEQTASEMQRLVDMHRAHEKAGVPAEAEAAWIHHRFTQIHPFQDGNGRVARALASLVLIRAGMFPLIVPRDDKPQYLETLELADKEDLRPLTLLIARRQQAEYRKASDLSARLAPDSKTAREAATALALAIRNRDDSRRSRMSQWAQQLAAINGQTVTNTIGSALNEVRSAVPNISFARNTAVPPETDDAHYSGQILETWGFERSAYIRKDTWSFSVPRPWTLCVWTFGVPDDIDEGVLSVASIEYPNAIVSLEVSPLIYSPGEDQASLERASRHWADEVVARAFDHLRRSL